LFSLVRGGKGAERRVFFRGLSCRKHTHGLCQLRISFPWLKIEPRRALWGHRRYGQRRRRTRARTYFRIVHVKAVRLDRSPALIITYGSLNAFTGGLMEEWGRGSTLAVRTYMAVRCKNKEPFELDVEHVLGRKAHSKMLELRGVGWDDRRHGGSDAQR
jgi:hypothetical protein